MIARDKIAHLIYSLFGSALLSQIAITAINSKVIGSVIGGLCMLLIGISKEVIHDKLMHKGGFEWLDVLADLLGSIIGAIAVFLLYQ